MSSAFNRSAKLRHEIELWQQEGLVSAEQAARLQQRYQLNEPAPWYQRSGFILRGLALLLVALGFFLFISQNWHHMGQLFRFATGMVPLLATYALGCWFLHRRQRDEAELAFFFASIAFGVNIMLQAQIFHLGTYYPDGVLWWLIGALPVAVYFRSNLHLVLALGLFLMWLILQAQYEQFNWWAPPLFAVLVYFTIKGKKTVAVVLLALSYYLFFVHIQFAFFDSASLPALLAGLSLLLLAVLPLLATELPAVLMQQLQKLGLWLLIFQTYLFSFPDFTRDLHKLPISWLAAVLAVAAVGIAIWKRYTGAAFLWTVGFAALFFVSSLFDIVVVANLLLVAHIAWRLVHGIRTRQKDDFMVGVGLLLLLAFSRYIDLTDNYLAGAALFVLSGLLLLLANHFWNKRYAA